MAALIWIRGRHLTLVMIVRDAAIDSTVTASDGRCLRRCDRHSWQGLDLAKRIEVLVLPLVDSHVQFLPLALQCLISQLLLHLAHSKMLEQLFVVDQVVVHTNQLLLDLTNVNV